MDLYRNLIQTKILSTFAGEFMGEDEFNNKYYQERLLFGKPQRMQRRWVIYKKNALEASSIPPKWFSWLHYTTERPLSGEPHPWEKPHVYNKTGSNEAYHPKRSLLNKQPKEDKAFSTPYNSWKPKK